MKKNAFNAKEGKELFKRENIALKCEAYSAEDAIRGAGNLLVKNGYATDDFITGMLNVYHDLGSYIVIARGLALPHARPECGALRTGFSLITLKSPVNFGNKDNDPVKVVIAMSAVDDQAHIATLKTIAEVFNDSSILDLIYEESDVDAVLNILENGILKKETKND